MKTWRERILEARAAGRFTTDDRWLASASGTCAVGEVCHGDKGHEWYVKNVLLGEETNPSAGWTVGTHHSAAFTGAVLSNRIDEAESILDAIEDRALQLKREASQS